jgi:hypothetical protein
MDIDFAPYDVATLQRMVRTLAAERTVLSEAQAEIERLQLIVQKLQRNPFADDTPIPVLDRGRTKTGRLWVYARDDRPWNGPDPPAAVYLIRPDRKGW